MNTVLMIAFHFPPYVGSSSVHRTVKFCRYLLPHGWRPIVLSAHPRAYPGRYANWVDDLAVDTPVARAFAVDTAKHLSVRGAYPRWLALPDRWVSWWFGALPAGLRLVRRYRPNLIWSTYPIATSHLVGLSLHRLTGLPWVADFRDPMTDDDYPKDVLVRRLYHWIERHVVRHASRLVFTATSMRAAYLKRYPALHANHCLVIPNGYDEEDFNDLRVSHPERRGDGRPLRLVHAGVVYREERDPRPLFRAISRLKNDARVSAGRLKIDLRAAGSEHYYSAIINELGIDDIVHLLPALPYRRALQDCIDADALLLLQDRSCNRQIPAKAYEYLRAARPILALTADAGDTAELLRETGGATIVDMKDENGIYSRLPLFLASVESGTHPLPDRGKVEQYERKAQARDLARCLDRLLDQA